MTLPPVSHEVVVDAPPAVAFEQFLGSIGDWWPLEEHSVHGSVATVALVDGEIVETGPDGERDVWGTVTRWEPPTAMGFTWHPGAAASRASEIAVTVEPGTRVRLEHTGWEAYDDPAAMRAGYDEGWPGVLAAYAALVDSVVRNGES